MPLRRKGLFVVPALLGCWSLKPADEVPDGGAVDVARLEASAGDVATDTPPSDVSVDAAASDAGMDVARVDVGADAGMDVARVDVGTDAGMDVARVDVGTDAGMDVARVDVGMDVPLLMDRRTDPLDTGPVDAPLVIPPDLRLIGPPGLSTVSDGSPTLIWSVPVAGVRLLLCRDRRCSSVVYTSMVVGTQHEVLAALGEGVYFWNLQRLDNGANLTATWQFRVPRVQGRRGGVPAGVTHRDMDNDGFVDLAVGAPGPLGTTSAGSLQIHFGGPTVSPQPGLPRTGPSGVIGYGYGWRMAWGDFNRDNRADLAVGMFDPSQNRSGRVDVLRSEGRAFATPMSITGANPTTEPLFATNLTSGDLNGDGCDDLVASSVGGSGQVQVHLGSTGGLAAMPVVVPNPLARRSVFGATAVVVGDVDGDGFGDLLVGDTCDPPQIPTDPPRCQPTSTGAPGPNGRMHLFFGRESWVATDAPRVTIEGDTSGRLGRAAAPAGDLNGDGYADFVVSGTTAPDEDTSGVVHVYLGRPRMQWMQTVSPHRSLNGASINALLGVSVAALDVNRDGRTDILAGASGRVAGVETYQGSVLVWLANTVGGYDPALAMQSAGTNGGLFGEVVASVGDMNGDGWGDLVVTAPLNAARSFARGEAYLWTHNRGPFPGTPPSVTVSGQTNNAWLGRGLAP